MQALATPSLSGTPAAGPARRSRGAAHQAAASSGRPVVVQPVAQLARQGATALRGSGASLRVAAVSPRRMGGSKRATAVALVPRRASRRAAVKPQAFLGRLFRVFQAYVSSFTSSLEDPEVLLDRCMQEMQADLVKMRQAAARVTARGKQVERHYAEQQAAADEWLRRAQLAVARGEDELARQALIRGKTFEQAAQSVRGQVDLQAKARDQLAANVRTLEGKLAEAANKRASLKARAASAKSSKQIQEFIGGLRLNTSSAWAAFDHMEEQVVALEAEAEGAALLATPDGLEAQFARLEGGGAVETELAALKAGLLAPPQQQQEQARRAAGGAAAAGGAGRPLVRDVLVVSAAASSVDWELEELRRQARSG